MNNGNNPKKVGIEMLKRTQILYQNNAISEQEKNVIVSYIQEGMTTGTFYKLNQRLFEVLEKTSLPQVVEDMIAITF